MPRHYGAHPGSPTLGRDNKREETTAMALTMQTMFDPDYAGKDVARYPRLKAR